MEAVQKFDSASSLDPKTEELTYIAVLASARLESDIPFHVKHAKLLRATGGEIISAVLVGGKCGGPSPAYCFKSI